MKPLVFKPGLGGMAFLVAAVVGFTLAGLWMLTSDQWSTKFFGVLSILFFGVGGVLALIKMIKNRHTLTADHAGIRPGNGGFVEWANVESIGKSNAGGTASLGVRVRDVDRYLASLTPAERQTAIQFAKGARAVAPGLANAGHPQQVAPGMTEERQVMEWSRSVNEGYDLLFAGATLGRSVDEAVSMLTAYAHEVNRPA